MVQVLEMVLHIRIGDQNVVKIREDILDREAAEHELHQRAKIAWAVFSAHWSDEIFQMHGFRGEGKELAVVLMHRNLPEALR